MAGRRKRTEPGKPKAQGLSPGNGDPLDQEIDAALAAGRAVRLLGLPDASGRRSQQTHIHPETGEPIGQGEGADEAPLPPLPPTAPADAAPEEAVPPMPQAGDTPADRLRNIRKRSPEYTEEYELTVLARLLQRNMPLDSCAAMLGCSVRTIYYKRDKLRKQLAAEAADFSMGEHIGGTINFFQEISGKAMQMADNPSLKPHTRLAALQAAGAAKNDLIRFLAVSGVYRERPYRPAAEKDGRSEGGDFIFEMERALLKGFDSVGTLLEQRSKAGSPDSEGDARLPTRLL